MIQLIDIAAYIENGLNAVLGSDAGYEFRVWADAGEMVHALRTGNSVTQWIPANLRSVSSANENNILVMGANGLMLDLAIPVKRLKTSAGQTPEELEKIQNGQYPFIAEVRAVIDDYFQLSQVFTKDDADGVSYTVSMEAGRAQTGVVDILPVLDECLTVSVFISLTFLQGGINARNVVLNIDGVRVPLLNVTFGRANRLSSDVYSDAAVVKNIATATALSIDFSFPANADNSTKQAFFALLDGKPNIVHFVSVQIGSAYDGNYLMVFDNLTMNAQGVLFAGLNGSLIEAVENPLMLDTPDYMQVGRFTLASSATETLTFTATGTAFIAGQVHTFNGASTVELSPADFVYSEDDDTYYVYMISLAAMAVTGSSATFTVTKEAISDG